jgi:hypothetical protein
MIEDVVIDTDVMKHASDPRQELQAAAVAFLEQLQLDECGTCICVDEGFHPIEARNSSRIVSEYRSRLDEAGLAMQVFRVLLESNRYRVVARPALAIRKVIQEVVSDKHDHVFAQVAAGSVERVLVSHDKRAYSPRARASLEKKLGIVVINAEQGLAVMAGAPL